MSNPFRSFSAVFPILVTKESNITKILLHRRQNTGYQDGKLDIAASGHVDEGETAISAAIRECKEEIGINVKACDLTFVHLQHRLSGRAYYDIYFTVTAFSGLPAIMEPEKCSELLWCDITNLPDDMIECRKMVIQEYIKGNFYSELVES